MMQGVSASGIKTIDWKAATSSVQPTSATAAREASAAKLSSMSTFNHLTEAARQSPPLTILDFEQMLRDSKTGSGKMYVKREFDDQSKGLAEKAFKALRETESRASTFFHTLRRPNNAERISPAHHAAFKQDREHARQTRGDVSQRATYQSLSRIRILRDAVLDLDENVNDLGKSALEKLLPEDSQFRAVLEPTTGAIRDVHTGLHADLRKKPLTDPPVYQLIFPGTGTVNTEGKQWLVNIRQFLGVGGVPKAYQDAVKLADEIAKSLPSGATLELVGHSMGGGIACYAALKHNMPAVCLNAALLGGDCMDELKKSKCLTTERLGKIHQLRIEGDPVSSRTVSKVLKAAAALLSPFGPGRAPKLLGTVHQIGREHPYYPTGSMLLRHTSAGFEKAFGKG